MVLSNTKPVGIKDVAQYAGVSISTVSNVLNETKPVSPALKKRVQEAVKILGYETNLAGRQLKTGKSQQIAFVLHSITSIFFPNLLKSIQDSADKAGYTVSVFGTKGDPERELRTINLLRSQGYDGVLLSSCADIDRPETTQYLEFLHEINFAPNPMHIICVEAAISSELDAVVINDTDGIMKITEYLIKKGRRHFAHISAPTQYMTGKNRLLGYKMALMLNDITVDSQMIEEGDFTCKSGYTAMQELLKKDLPIDAVVAGNDQMAIGAIKCLEENGLKIPDDIAVVGFNDNNIASMLTPSLTTVHVPKAEMGKWAFDLFQRRINGDRSARMLIQLEGIPVIRNSTDPDIVTQWDMDW